MAEASADHHDGLGALITPGALDIASGDQGLHCRLDGSVVRMERIGAGERDAWRRKRVEDILLFSDALRPGSAYPSNPEGRQ